MTSHAFTALAASCLLAFSGLAAAQSAAPAKPAAKPKAVAKPVAKTAKKSPAAVRRDALKAVEEVTPIDDDPSITLKEEDLEVAKRVYIGEIPCELGASVKITPSERRPGFFVVQTKGARFSMHPVESRTGAIRLEDPRRGAMWLQLGNKSMLMSQKVGQRLADECMSPQQVTFADELKKNPRPSILDALPSGPHAGTGSAAASETPSNKP
ncbi:MAG: hypothetical protein EON92_12450 [Burkholderiales bacterium]|nr:MAG: hypothetical protein EON92_12450 [Burkholderiales bacterium]